MILRLHIKLKKTLCCFSFSFFFPEVNLRWELVHDYSLYQFVVVPLRDIANALGHVIVMGDVVSCERVPYGMCERGKFTQPLSRQPVYLQRIIKSLEIYKL